MSCQWASGEKREQIGDKEREPMKKSIDTVSISYDIYDSNLFELRAMKFVRDFCLFEKGQIDKKAKSRIKKQKHNQKRKAVRRQKIKIRKKKEKKRSRFHRNSITT